MRTIKAHLCPRCARMLRQPWLRIEHIDTHPRGSYECVWCERSETDRTYCLQFPDLDL